jgi:beta-lactamase regulating signal transducer with metallopeptidase domain
MIAAWIVYGLAVSAVLSLAALLMERAARWIGGATRWTWAGALVLGWTLPFLAGRLSERGAAGMIGGREGASSQTAESGRGVLAVVSEPLRSAAAELGNAWSLIGSAATAVDFPLTVIWIAAAGFILSALAITYRRLRIRSYTWPLLSLHGHQVRMSEDLGPAVLGVGHGQVVLPRWAVECPPSHRRLIVLHEVEHLRAGDERLLFAAVIAVALMPWNLFAWWQLRRLRLAVELDCDRRVLGTGVQIREYASLLLEAGSRRGASPMTAAVFVHFHSQLGRRIREMTEKRKGPRYVPAALATVGALVLLVAACETPVPTDPDDLQEITAGKQVSQVDPADGDELHRILETDDDVTLVIEKADGETFVIDAVKLGEIREQGHAKALIRRLKARGEPGELKLTLVHEDGSETASFGTLVELQDPASNELVEVRPHAEGEYEFGSDQTRSMMKPRTGADEAKIKQLKAAEMEARKKTEGGSR